MFVQQAFSVLLGARNCVRHLGTAMDLPTEVLLMMRGKREAKDLALGSYRVWAEYNRNTVQGVQHPEEASGGRTEEERPAQKVEKIEKGLQELQGDLWWPSSFFALTVPCRCRSPPHTVLSLPACLGSGTSSLCPGI